MKNIGGAVSAYCILVFFLIGFPYPHIWNLEAIKSLRHPAHFKLLWRRHMIFHAVHVQNIPSSILQHLSS